MILLFEQNAARVENSGKKTFLEGLFLPIGDRPTGNKRVYTTEHLNDLVSDLQPTIREGGLVGELNHSQSSTVDINRVSHVIKSLRHKGQGQFWGRAEVLKEGAGKFLQSAIDAGMRVGTSVKATGEPKKLKDGNDLVLPEKYNLVSIDAVHSPANGHYVKSIKESILSESLSMNDSALAVDILRRLDKQLHTDLASQQNRMSTSDTYDNLFAGHDGFPSLKNLRMAALQHLQRMDDEHVSSSS